MLDLCQISTEQFQRELKAHTSVKHWAPLTCEGRLGSQLPLYIPVTGELSTDYHTHKWKWAEFTECNSNL